MNEQDIAGILATLDRDSGRLSMLQQTELDKIDWSVSGVAAILALMENDFSKVDVVRLLAPHLLKTHSPGEAVSSLSIHADRDSAKVQITQILTEAASKQSRAKPDKDQGEGKQKEKDKEKENDKKVLPALPEYKMRYLLPDFPPEAVLLGASHDKLSALESQLQLRERELESHKLDLESSVHRSMKRKIALIEADGKEKLGEISRTLDPLMKRTRENLVKIQFRKSEISSTPTAFYTLGAEHAISAYEKVCSRSIPLLQTQELPPKDWERLGEMLKSEILAPIETKDEKAEREQREEAERQLAEKRRLEEEERRKPEFLCIFESLGGTKEACEKTLAFLRQKKVKNSPSEHKVLSPMLCESFEPEFAEMMHKELGIPYDSKTAPPFVLALNLNGLWVNAAGLAIGGKVRIRTENGSITIVRQDVRNISIDNRNGGAISMIGGMNLRPGTYIKVAGGSVYGSQQLPTPLPKFTAIEDL